MTAPTSNPVQNTLPHSLCETIMGLTTDYFKDAVNIRNFIDWHKKRHGYPPADVDLLTNVAEQLESLS